MVGSSLLAFALISYVQLSPGKHDDNWWRHVGLPEHHPTARADGKTSAYYQHLHADDSQRRGTGAHARRQVDARAVLGARDPVRAVEGEEAASPQHEVPTQRSTLNLKGSHGVAATEGGKPFALTKGVHYFSDYDIDAIQPPPKPLLRAPAVPDAAGGKMLFHYVDPDTANPPLRYVSSKPVVAVVPNFLSAAECDAMIRAAEPRMARSAVVPYKESKDKRTVQDVRTSTQTWLMTDSPAAKAVVDRILAYTGFPPGSSEALQILRYEKGQKYDAHLDYFDPRYYGRQASNRAVTVYLYLSDVEEGGETQFPRADGKGPTYDFTSCKAGLKVRPRKGTVAIFYDMDPYGGLQEYSLHGACPVVHGTKWGGTLWLRVNEGGHLVPGQSSPSAPSEATTKSKK